MAKTIEAIGVALIFGVFCITGLVVFMSEFTNPSTYNTVIGGENLTRDMRHISSTMNDSMGDVYSNMYANSTSKPVQFLGIDISTIADSAFGQFLIMGYNMVQVLFKMPEIVLNVIHLSVTAGEGSPMLSVLVSLGITLGAVVSLVLLFQFLKLFMHQEV